MTTRWYYMAADAQVGPVSMGGLKQRIYGGTIGPNTLVRQASQRGWVLARHVEGLFALDAPALSRWDDSSRASTSDVPSTVQARSATDDVAIHADEVALASEVETAVPDEAPAAPADSIAAPTIAMADTSAEPPSESSPPVLPTVSSPVGPPPATLFDPYSTWLGIHVEEQPPNHYRLLGIRLLEDDPGVIENASDGRMLHLRNHQTGQHWQLAQKLLNEIAAARICLLNPERKAAYDQPLRRELKLDGAGWKGVFRDVVARYGRMASAAATLAILLAAFGLVLSGHFDNSEDAVLPPRHAALASSSTRQDSTEPTTAPSEEPVAPSSTAPVSSTAPASLESNAGVPPILAAPVSHPADSSPDPVEPAVEQAVEQARVSFPSSASAPNASAPSGTRPPSNSVVPPGKVQPGSSPNAASTAASDAALPSASFSTSAAESEPMASPPDGPPSAAAPEHWREKERLARLRDVVKKQADLHKLCKSKQDELLPVEEAQQKLHARLAGFDRMAKLVNAQARNVQQALPPGTNLRGIPQWVACQTTLAQIAVSVRDVNMQVAQNLAVMQELQSEMDRLARQSDQLGQQWFVLCDPKARWGEPVHRRSLGTLDEWIAAGYQSPLLYLARGFAHLHTGKFDLALADFDRITADVPCTRSIATAARACTLGRQGQSDQAQAAFNDAVKVIEQWKQAKNLSREETREVNRALARVHVLQAYDDLARDNYPGAEKSLKAAFRLAPKCPVVLESLAALYATCPAKGIRSGKQALTHATDAWALVDGDATYHSDRWVYLDTLAAAYAESGDFAKAAESAREAIRAAPREQEDAVRRRLQSYESGRPYRQNALRSGSAEDGES
ncbi:MAG: DUF4339 domain-containing protein [Pirellulales bacterium]|nr:DUF4339 domain-containing protein [Pirellulales bacterium]